jgi:hypothetical protein
MRIQKIVKKLTASGNVQDLHLIPFSSAAAETFAMANVVFETNSKQISFWGISRVSFTAKTQRRKAQRD